MGLSKSIWTAPFLLAVQTWQTFLSLCSAQSSPPGRNSCRFFSLVLFVSFSWTLYRMFWQIQSWLFTVSLGVVLVLAAYALAFALIESVIVMGLMVFLSLLLPARVFKAQFVAQASAVFSIIVLGAVALQRNLALFNKLALIELIAYPLLFFTLVIILAFVFSFLFKRFSALPALINTLADRMIVFSYIYIPLGLFSLAVVIFRNIF